MDKKTIWSLVVVTLTSPMALVGMIHFLGVFLGIIAFVAYVLAQSWLLKKFWELFERKQ